MKFFMSFEPGSNQRPQDGILQLQSRALPTELSKDNENLFLCYYINIVLLSPKLYTSTLGTYLMHNATFTLGLVAGIFSSLHT